MNSTSLNEIAFNILNSYRGGRSSNTEHITIEQIKFNVNYYRAVFIRRDLQRNLNRSRMFEQDLGHVALSSVDSAEDDSISSSNIILRTDNKIPTPIRLKNKEGLTFIGSKDKVGEPIPLLDDVRTYWQQYSKYTADSSFATYRDGYVYIHNNISLQNINIRGIFEDPEEVFEFTTSGGLSIYDENSAYPIASDMLEGITKAILNGELKLLASTQDDKEANMNQD